MPIIEHIKHDFCTQIVIWESDELEDNRLDDLYLNEIELKQFKKISQKKGLEFLTIRACLNKLDIKSSMLKYNQNGKPYLENGSFISISHSNKFTCVAFSTKLIGVDVELSRPEKVANIQSKFIREDELIWLNNKTNKTDFLHIIWGIKESLYKLDGGIFWNFLEYYKVNEFDLVENKAIECFIDENENSREFYAFYRKIEDYFLVWVTKKE